MGGKTGFPRRRCGERVTFPDGTTVFGLNIDDRRGDDRPPDFGLYLDRAWKPTWDATVIDWDDFEGSPPSKPLLFKEIERAFRKAQSRKWVEVGCLAGIGRTGTALACMAVISGVSADESVCWIRHYYDPYAVEGEEQESLIAEFAGWFAKRKKPRPKHTDLRP
jgi:Protein-tyrosine phosphatase